MKNQELDHKRQKKKKIMLNWTKTSQSVQRSLWSFRASHVEYVSPCWPSSALPSDVLALEVSGEVFFLLLSRSPGCSLLLQHGLDGGGHHGGGHHSGGHGWCERSQRILGVFPRDINTLEVSLACGNRMVRNSFPQCSISHNDFLNLIHFVGRLNQLLLLRPGSEPCHLVHCRLDTLYQDCCS